MTQRPAEKSTPHCSGNWIISQKTLTKKTIKLNLPIQVGFFVYQYAKLRMLQFCYDFLDKYLDRTDFQMCEMDTDSAYIAILGERVESSVKPELRVEFHQDKCN